MSQRPTGAFTLSVFGPLLGAAEGGVSGALLGATLLFGVAVQRAKAAARAAAMAFVDRAPSEGPVTVGQATSPRIPQDRREAGARPRHPEVGAAGLAG